MKLVPFLLLTLLLTSPVYASSGPIIRPVQQTFVGDNYFSVLPHLDMGPEFEGRTVEYLVLQATSENGKGQASVSVDGRDIAPAQTIGSESKVYTFELPSAANRISNDIDAIQFHLRGRLNVEAIGIKMVPGRVPPPGPTNPRPGPPHTDPLPPPPDTDPIDNPSPPAPPPIQPPPEPIVKPILLKLSIQQYVMQSQILPLSAFVNLRKYSNLRLKRVVLHASSRYGSGTATFCTNSGCKKRGVEEELAPYIFNGYGESVREFGNVWRFGLRGDFWIERIDIEFVK